MTILDLQGARFAPVSDAVGWLQTVPAAHHGGFHMSEWPWWPGPMHIAYPLLFFAAIVFVVVLLLRKS